ncbi:hypothetical protein SAMN05216198_2051 [Halopseudomonas litoralis]|uniref:Uncharacterized protein n=1 Tax=Halopseudomonas litoralis TaxID=797277 RepID=A0A1H1SJK7_9GAMM|nr:hypothetical protein [Halopseudomonas litoralis]SDS48230.1 hypothetical protein SAMN05216198_2051 [Halopseudomonas litoralis]
MQEHEAHGSSQTEITTGDIGQLEALVCLIGNDAFAMSFQSVRQYREALLNAAPAVQGESSPCRCVQCERCQGNGEIITDWERYENPRPCDAADAFVVECPDCRGVGRLHVATEAMQPAEQQPDKYADCDLECGAYGTYCKCAAEAQQPESQQPKCCTCRDGMDFTTINGVDIAVGEDLTDGVYTLNVMAQGQDGPIVLVHIHQHRCATRETPQPAPDVSGLVEALEGVLDGRPLDTEFWDRCEQFIAAHRKGGIS